MSKKKQLTLSKWPFYLGNIFLVLLACVIAFKGNGPITAGMALWSILCVLFGAMFFAMPFVLEYQARERLKAKEVEDRAKMQTRGVEYLMSQMRAMENTLDEHVKRNERVTMYMEGLLKRLDGYVDVLEGTMQHSPKAQADLTDTREETNGTPQLDADMDCSVGEAEPQNENVQTLIDIDFQAADTVEEAEYNDGESEEAERFEDDAAQSEDIPTAVVDACGQLSKVLARGMFGIGNKPFIRGEGGGLNWDKGMPMEFLGMGKWQWAAPNLQEPVTFRIYKNDEIAAAGEPLCLIPGEEREVDVRF